MGVAGMVFGVERDARAAVQDNVGRIFVAVD